MNNDNFINELGVFKAAVTRCFEREAKGKSKPACYIEFERLSDKAICSMRFSNPLMASDLFRISKIIRDIKGKSFKVDQLKKKSQKDLIAYLNGFKGECVNIYVRPFEFTTQTGQVRSMYNVEDVVNGKFEVSKPVSQEDFEAGFEDPPQDPTLPLPDADDIPF